MATLFYVHDPMCSWCWGFDRVWRELRAALPQTVEVVSLLGGLAPDSDAPMPMAMQQSLQQTWKRIEQHVPGTAFNHAFWSACAPRRSTYRACRAVCTAEHLKPGSSAAMTTAIQSAYYTQAKNPSDVDVLADAAATLGVDRKLFAELLDSAEMRTAHAEQMAQAQSLHVDSYPTLVLVIRLSQYSIPLEYNNAGSMLRAIENHL